LLFDRRLPDDTVYSFTYKENSIRFLFGLLSFDDRTLLTIEYALNGHTWMATDIRSPISFANLAPGKYDLAVRVKNEPVAPIHIHFEVYPPFWKAGWFVVLVMVALLAIFILLVRTRLQRVRREEQLRQKIMASEMSALRSQMNPHFIFNTLNSINSYIIENKKDEASDYLTDFSRLMRIILDHSRKRTVTLTEELYALKLYLELESRRLEGAFDYTIHVGSGIDAQAVLIPPLIIQPYVENAIWHGLRGRKTGGHIEVKVGERGEGIEIVVQDDGIGRAAAAKSEKLKQEGAFGTDATRQRILLHDPGASVKIEDLYDANGQAAGTRVSIYVNQQSS
jgi:LytS/YehU family sensor histidine kinase